MEWNVTIMNRWVVRKEEMFNGRPLPVVLWNCETLDVLIDLLIRNLPKLEHVMRPVRDTRTFRQVLGDAAPA